MGRALRISAAEWEVMAVVWEKAPIAASDVAEVLAQKKEWALATVRTLLRRLVDKGALEQALDGKRLLYKPRVTMAECVQRESESFLDRVLGRTPSDTLLHLVRETNLSSEDIEELRRILRQKEKKL
jgi:BlaI family transcriptional regulator, penicillinase repressor